MRGASWFMGSRMMDIVGAGAVSGVADIAAVEKISLWDKLKSTVASVADKVGSVVQSVADAVANNAVVSGVVNTVTTAVNAPAKIINSVTGAVDGVGKGVGGIGSVLPKLGLIAGIGVVVVFGMKFLRA